MAKRTTAKKADSFQGRHSDKQVCLVDQPSPRHVLRPLSRVRGLPTVGRHRLWNGEYFFDRIGRYRGEVDEWTFDRLAAEIERMGFFEWADRYEEAVTDHSTFELEVVRDGTTKRVIQYATDQPLGFSTIAMLIDGVAASIDWSPSQAESSRPGTG